MPPAPTPAGVDAVPTERDADEPVLVIVLDVTAVTTADELVDAVLVAVLIAVAEDGVAIGRPQVIRPKTPPPPPPIALADAVLAEDVAGAVAAAAASPKEDTPPAGAPVVPMARREPPQLPPPPNPKDEAEGLRVDEVGVNADADPNIPPAVLPVLAVDVMGVSPEDEAPVVVGMDDPNSLFGVEEETPLVADGVDEPNMFVCAAADVVADAPVVGAELAGASPLLTAMPPKVEVACTRFEGPVASAEVESGRLATHISRKRDGSIRGSECMRWRRRHTGWGGRGGILWQ